MMDLNEQVRQIVKQEVELALSGLRITQGNVTAPQEPPPIQEVDDDAPLVQTKGKSRKRTVEVDFANNNKYLI